MIERVPGSDQLAGQYSRGRDFASDYMGSIEPLPNRNEFVGWGSNPYFSEYDASGRLLLDAKLPGPNLSYRAKLEQWVGLPRYSPVGAARRRAGRTTVYASWNGATQVARWKVLAASSGSGPHVVARSPKSGFETAIPVGHGYQRFNLQALDANGRVIGVSREFGTR